MVWSLNSLTLRRRLTARKAVEVGAAGVIVSNHGARQLDYAPPTISALEEVTPPAGRIQLPSPDSGHAAHMH